MKQSQKRLLKLALEKRKINNNENKGNMFIDQIFLGSGHSSDETRNFSGQEVALLHYLLDSAIETLGGIQQNGLQGYEFDNDSHNKGEEKLKNIVHNIVVGLLGKQEEVAYLVFCPSGEYEYRIFTDRNEAELVAEEYNEQEDTDHYKAIPLVMKI